MRVGERKKDFVDRVFTRLEMATRYESISIHVLSLEVHNSGGPNLSFGILFVCGIHDPYMVAT